MLTREQMAMRVAQELRDRDYVNLGIGIPTLVANYIPAGIEVMLQSENGLLGMGEFPDEATIDADMINAGKQTVTAQTGAAIFDSAQSFAMIRGGHVDLTVLGAFEVDVTIHLLVTAADIANRHLTRVVTSTRALLGAEQRFLRLVRRDFLERADNLMSRTCGNRFKFFYCHLR